MTPQLLSHTVTAGTTFYRQKSENILFRKPFPDRNDMDSITVFLNYTAFLVRNKKDIIAFCGLNSGNASSHFSSSGFWIRDVIMNILLFPRFVLLNGITFFSLSFSIRSRRISRLYASSVLSMPSGRTSLNSASARASPSRPPSSYINRVEKEHFR